MMTACWPSCTMKMPLPSQISAITPEISATPMPALVMSGWKLLPPSPPDPLPRGPPPLPLNRPLSLRLKSRHSSSRSGGPSPRPPVASCRCGAAPSEGMRRPGRRASHRPRSARGLPAWAPDDGVMVMRESVVCRCEALAPRTRRPTRTRPQLGPIRAHSSARPRCPVPLR